MDMVEITAARQRIKLKSTEQGHNINSKDMENMPVDEITELIGLKAGVVAQGGELHFRGGRGGEVQYQVDGVPVRDPLVGGGVSLAALAIESADVIMGGLDAQYGNAQSGRHQLQDEGRRPEPRGGNLLPDGRLRPAGQHVRQPGPRVPADSAGRPRSRT